MRSLFDRAQAVTLKEEHVYEEKNHLENALQDNGYPKPFIQRSLERQRKPDGEKQPHLTTVTIPYIAEISERIRRVSKDIRLDILVTRADIRYTYRTLYHALYSTLYRTMYRRVYCTLYRTHTSYQLSGRS